MKISGEVKFIGDSYQGAYANGLTMLGGASIQRFTLIEETEDEVRKTTEDGVTLQIKKKKGKNPGVKVIESTIINNSDKEYVLEMITSFLLSGIKADKVHRMLSFWSAEGRHKVDDIKDLNLEVSWTGHANRVHKFANLGSMPIRGYFPFIAVEDSESGHFTAIQLYSPSSWQIEILVKGEQELTLAGGIADRDYGHWTKKLKAGESFVCPKAVVAEGNSFLEVCNLLVEEQSPNISPIDNEMGITFNEYCTTWGDPSFENLKKIADKIEGKGIQYLVMDSGWYLEKGQYWWDYIGKWEVNKERFPNGLKELTDYIRSKNMIPGIWFEPESLAFGSSIFNDSEYILTKDGYPLDIAGKRFLDMESEKAREFLRNTVIRILKENEFGYIKIDYNDTIGIGCDGEESLGENLRRKVLASQDFFKELKREIPELVIENCSSGGHRLEPSMMQLSSMASFSDAHEIKAIPIIAANLQLMVKPCQNQIWAVLRKEDSDSRIYYSLISTMLGRMGLSGDIYDLSEHQWQLIDEGIAFYKNVSDIIKNGRTVIFEGNTDSWNKPTGYQLVGREYENRILLTLHRFEDPENKAAEAIQTIRKMGNVLSEYGSTETDFSARAWLIEKG